MTAEERAVVHDEIVNWMLDGKLNGMDFVSDVFSFDNILDAVKLLESRKYKKKDSLSDFNVNCFMRTKKHLNAGWRTD